MEYMKDCNFTISYHLGKPNVVTDALRRKKLMTLETLKIQELGIIQEFSIWDPMMEEKTNVCYFIVKPKLKAELILTHRVNLECRKMKLVPKTKTHLFLEENGSI